MNRFENISKEYFLDAASKSTSYRDLEKSLGLPLNGTSIRWIKNKIQEYDFDIKIFEVNKLFKYKIKKECQNCGKEFWQNKGERSRSCCSYSCANSYFRSGVNNPNFKTNGVKSYITLCFSYHPKKCIICGEENIVSVHHWDNNHSNNAIENLIPLCPTHHQYMHSRYKYLIQDAVDDYRNTFIQKQGIA